MEGIAFLVLGPLEVRNAGQPVPVRGIRERAVLAALLLAKGGLVPMAALVEATWSGQPPDAADKAVRNAVSALRGRLSRADATGLIETSIAGYRLPLAGVYLDAVDFEQRVAEARTLAGAGQPGPAAQKLRAALELWRGPALAGTGGPVLEAAAARLDEQRLAALEECVDLELQLGRHRELTGELRTLASEWPLRERLAAQLMLALYRSGRQDEALDAYRSLTRRLADDLGLDPSPAVAALHEAILRQDPGLELDSVTIGEPGEDSGASAGGADAALTSAQVRPAQLPLDVPGFTGRAAELAQLHALLPSGGSGPDGATVVISAIGGTAGVGKTALAVRFAHEAAPRFPDGQLYVNLGGFGPVGSPMKPEEALRGFLHALGVAPGVIPAEVTAQAGLYRTLLAGRRMLVLLDNAADAAQIRPLLPGSPGCMVLVTSRRQLTGLAAAEGARLLTLDVLTEQEARDLLAFRLGKRLADEPAAVRELIGRCARLPLALAIAAARAAARPALTLGQLAAELRRAASPLDALDTGDQATSLRAVFAWSLRTLPAEPARLFVLLGRHPGPDFDGYAAAALADTSVAQARRWLDLLADAHLIQPGRGGRYTMHDLLRAYAADLAADPGATDPAAAKDAAESRAALERLLDYYLATAAAAMDRLYPAEAHRRPRVPAAGTPMPGLPDAKTAVAWLDNELPGLAAATASAAGGWPGHAIRLSATLFRYLQSGHSTRGLAIHGHAREAARQVGDRNAEAEAVRHLGGVYWRQGRYADAADCIRQAHAIYQRSGDRTGQARTLDNLGVASWHLGDRATAIQHQEQALILFRQAGDRYGQVNTLCNLGYYQLSLGRHEEAAAYLRSALTLAQQDGNREGEAHALNNLGKAEHRSGRPEEAAGYFRQALAVFTGLGHRTGEAWALTNLGTVLTSLGQPEQATEHHQRALVRCRAAGNRGDESAALNGLGEAASAAGHAEDAITQHSAALSVALDTGDREQQARAHVGLGRALDALAQPRRAHEHLRQALALYADLGYPEAEQIRTELAARQHPS